MTENQERKIEINVHKGGQINIATDNACITAQQNNGTELVEDEKLKDAIIGMVKDIEKYFVKTEAYNDALQKLKFNNIIMLVGRSGCGKSDSSKMLLMEYISEYSIKMLEGTDFGKTEVVDVLKLMKRNYSKKELVIFDDFLGKTELNKDEDYIETILNFLAFFTNNSNKKLILNSRKTIVEYAKTKSYSFKSYVENEIDTIIVDNFDNVEEKYKMISGYIQLNNLQEKCALLFPTQDLFRDVINHPNFSPLIIKRALLSFRKSGENKLLEMLNHPDEIWENEFKVLNDFSKKYLFILFSLSDSWIKKEYVQKAFMHYIDQTQIEYNENICKTVERLNVFLNFDEYERITFCHASIIDYLYKELSECEKNKIIEHALYFEQIERLDKTKEYIKKLYANPNKFFHFKVLPYTIFFPVEREGYIGIKYLDYMIKLKVRVDQDIVFNILRRVFEEGYPTLLCSSDIILKVLLLDIDFKEILDNDKYMQEFFWCLDYENMWGLINKMCDKSGENIDYNKLKPYIQDEIIQKFNDAISDKIIECIIKELSEHPKLYLDEVNEDDEICVEYMKQGVLKSIMENIDSEGIINRVIEDLCKLNKLDNYTEDIDKIEINLDASYEFITQFIEEFYGIG